MKPVIPSFSATFLIFTFSAFPALAATIHVPADQPTIQAGIDAALDGDLVLVAPGTYVENIGFPGRSITVRSEAGADVTLIDGNQVRSVVVFPGGGSEDMVLDGFTIANGNGMYSQTYYYGGGISCFGDSPTIANCTITGNSADFGGGINCYLSSATIANCTISDNTASKLGGGICCIESSPTITTSTITENESSEKGGGIFALESTQTVENCTISENISRYGGGVYCDESALLIMACSISGNRSTHGDGGGICCVDSSSEMTDCTIVDNSADDWGGGVYFSAYVSVYSQTITNCAITGNSASKGGGIFFDYVQTSVSSSAITGSTISENNATEGGGIFSYNHDLSVVNCMFTGNLAGYSGGALRSIRSDSTIKHCTFSENSALYGGGIFGDNSTITNSILWGDSAGTGDEIHPSSGSVVVAYSDIEGGWPGEGNIDADPLFLGGGDCHITKNSPCIDAGIDVGLYADIDGDERPQGLGFDMGADEHPECWDADGDGHSDIACGGYDCDDTSPGVNPWAEEICTGGIDEDCDGFTDIEDPECGIIRVPADQLTIQAAIDAAEDDNTVIVSPGTYWENINFRGKAIAVKSEAGFGMTAIDGGQQGSVVRFPSGDTEGALLEGFTIGNGSGSGISCTGSDPTIINCTIISNYATQGGGIYLNSSSPQIDACRILRNISIDEGGGIFCDDGSNPTIRGCTITGNSAMDSYDGRGGGISCAYSSPEIEASTITDNMAEHHGGGLYGYSSSLTITNSTIAGNRVERYYGGGICCVMNCSLEIENCSITENIISSSGGGIHCQDTTGTIANSTISGNSAGDGGGIFTLAGFEQLLTITNSTISQNSSGYSGGIEANAPIVIENCTISGNISNYEAGGIRCKSAEITNCTITGNSSYDGGGIGCKDGATTTITNCTITENIAHKGGGIHCPDRATTTITHSTISDNSAEYGGGIYAFDAATTIVNCIFWGDSATEGPEIWLGRDDKPAILTVRYSDVQGGEAAAFTGPDSTLYWLGGNINTEPIFVGGGDYHLSASSPCIDAGIDAGVYTDIDGDVRPFDTDFDMGSDEYTGEYWTLLLDTTYEEGVLGLHYTLGILESALWANYLILVQPSVRVIPLWTVPVPVMLPPVELPVSFPFPSLGWVGIYTALFTAEGIHAHDFDWVDTG